jgi:predicted RNA-binding protein with PUA-like domain
MNHWLMKSEPGAWSWDQMVAARTTNWSGVRNNAAALHMKHMRRGDLAFFYHSNEGKEIVGILEIVKEYYPDPTDEAGRFGMVDVKAVRPLKTPVTLAQIKADPLLKNLPLVKQSRLSVGPVDKKSWKTICRLGGV